MLGGWISTQRKTYKTGKISKERIQLLESVGFYWDLYQQEWEEMYQDLLQYKKENGDTNVPQRQSKLGRWVSTQRRLNNKNQLQIERKQLLDSIGFAWSSEKD